MIEKINNNLIKILKPRTKVFDVRDSQMKGFIVRVYPTGRMVFKCEYARGKRITIGDVHVVTVAQARERAKQILGDAAQGLDPKETSMVKKYGNTVLTFKQFFESEYKAWLKANRPDTCDDSIRRIKSSGSHTVGNLKLDEIKPHLIEKWRVDRLNNDAVQPITTNKEIIHLKSILARATKWGFIKENPLHGFELLRLADNSRVRYLEKDEYNRLMQALDSEEERLRAERDKGNAWRRERGYDLYPDLRNQTFASSLKPKVLISLGSGLRKCELRRIRRETHIDHQRKGLYLTSEVTKAKKPRFVPLDEKTWNVLTDWLVQTEQTIGKRGLVFPGKDGKSEFDNMKRVWQRLLKVANIEDFTWHDMRHDYASQLVMSGVDLNTVRELLGHADIKMTLRYAHLAPEHKIQAINKLGARREEMLK